MTDTVTTTQISDVGAVAVPVADQERALRFYVGTLGFEVRLDLSMGDGGRWLRAGAAGRRHGQFAALVGRAADVRRA